MSRFPLFLAAAALSAFPAGAQGPERPVPAATPKYSIVKHQVPSSIFAQESPLDALPVTVRTPGQMTEKDQRVEADAESSIAEHAGYAGLEFNRGTWSYRQIVCPALPNHLFLRFTRNQGKGDVSIFTASIPRNGQGRVRIIPIERRGYSMFSPAPANALTIAAFNHIRAEEQAAGPIPWVGISQCYAALASGHLATDRPAGEDDRQASVQPVASILSLTGNGGVVMRFTDMTAVPRPTAWALTFDRTGKLIKSSVKPAGIAVPRRVPAGPPLVTVPGAQPGGSAAVTPPA
jgi:hypothetical protein